MPKTLQVFEYSTLKVDPEVFPERHFDELVRYNERNQNQYFDVGHKRIYFKSFVGVIQVGRLTIEILPKADKSGPDDKTKWRNALLEMLQTCRLIKLKDSGRANLHLRSISLIDLYFEAFLEECRKLMQEGLRKAYRQDEGNLTSLKGRLLFNQQTKKNLVHRERFFTRYVRYDRNALHNQIIHTALSVLGQIGSQSLSSRAKALLLELDDITPPKITRKTFERITFDRNTDRYRTAITLARLIILNYSPDLKAGKENVLAILFDMNVLFEEYVFNLLRKGSRDIENLKVSSQRSKVFWRSESMTKTIRPDIVVEWEQDGSTDILIIDTKWKIPKDNRPSDDDLKQMYAYNLQFGAKQSVLLYPKTESSQSQKGRYSEAPTMHDAEGQSSQLHFAELFDDCGRLDKNLGISVLQNLIPEKKPSHQLENPIQI